MNSTQARQMLRRVGRRRKRLRQSEERLTEDTARVLTETKGLVPVTEAAKLAGIHRSTAHEHLKASN